MNEQPTLMLLACKEPWHTEAAYEDGGHPHYIECYEPVTEPLLTREEAANDPQVQAKIVSMMSGWTVKHMREKYREWLEATSDDD